MKTVTVNDSAVLSLYPTRFTYLEDSISGLNCQGQDESALTRCLMETQHRLLEDFECLPPSLLLTETLRKKEVMTKYWLSLG